MAEAVFLLCAVTSLACAVLLLRGYVHNRLPLLLWSSLCFVGLAVNNVLQGQQDRLSSRTSPGPATAKGRREECSPPPPLLESGPGSARAPRSD